MDAWVNVTDIMKLLEEDEAAIIMSKGEISVCVLDYILALKDKVRARIGATGDCK